jgi:hypothetical protein
MSVEVVEDPLTGTLYEMETKDEEERQSTSEEESE